MSLKDYAVKVAAFVAVAALVVLPAVTHAQFSTSTAATTVNGFVVDLSTIIAAVIAAILGLLAALVGLGWGIRKFLKWNGGRKF